MHLSELVENRPTFDLLGISMAAPVPGGYSRGVAAA